tara:strand:+ start:219 stop:659 length:441 start_codon:yes stop_codon:yes gene_type:complete
MAHFAKLDANNIVEQVIVVGNEDTADSSGTETEAIGVAFCQKLVGAGTNWKQTSYNNNMRGNYAGIGMTYMEGVRTLGVASTDVFIPQQPYASWTVGINTATWYPPANPGAAPELSDSDKTAGKYYEWNESNYQSNPSTAWVLVTP